MEDLSDQVDKIRESAARFYTVDLHLHSPLSFDWDNSASEEGLRDPDLDRIPVGNAIPDRAVAAYRACIGESGRDFVATTDHNASSFGEAAAAKNGEPGPHIVPGIELSVCFSDTPLIRDLRLHVLAVFPEDAHRDAFARILPAGTAAEDARIAKTTLPYPSVDKLIDLIHREGGLAIAAHVEAKNGLRGLYRNTAKLLLEPIGGSREQQEVLRALGDQVKDELVKFDAIQVSPATDASHYAGPKGGLRVPLLVASDCHKAKNLATDQSENYSYVKMARPSFEALCDALKFPDLRVRLKPGLPRAKPPRLLGLRIVGHKATERTFFNDTVFGFSDNLTCLIGPRGSGKSAAIDALRYLMGYNRTLDQIAKVADQVVDRQKHTLEKSRVAALYEAADGRVYQLVATYDPHEDYVTEVYDADDARVNIEDVEESGEFPLNVFGWGELELLAESPDTQRELLDRFIPAVGELKEAKRDVLLRLRENRRTCVENARRLHAYFTDTTLDFRRLNELKIQFEGLNTKEIEALFAQIDAVGAKRAALKKMNQELRQRLDKGDITPALGIAGLLQDATIKEWADTFSIRLRPEQLDDWMRKTSRQHKSRVEVALDVVKAEDETLRCEEEGAEKNIRGVIGEDQAISGDLRNRAKSRYDMAAANCADYRNLYAELDALLGERETLLDELDEYDKRLFATRHQETSRISDEVSLVEDEDYKINLVLQQQARRDGFRARLAEGGLDFRGQWRAGKRPEILSSKLTPRTLADAICRGRADVLAGLSANIDNKDYSLKREVAEQLIVDNMPCSEIEGLETVRVDPEKLENILRVQEVPIDDAFFITLGGKPIQHCSPGQRCSAMLPVVTLTSQAPLVIDQPEDNLDNRLVSRALFKILSRLKETRQIILATHNPNILVSGDAEQVLLLNADGELEGHGCIDDPTIIDAVLGLLEGGAEAFERRHKKYEPYL